MALVQPLDGGHRARVVAAGDQHQPRRVARDGGLQRVGGAGQLRGVPAGHLGGPGQGAGDLPLDGVAGDVEHHDAALGLVEGEQVGAGRRLARHQAEMR